MCIEGGRGCGEREAGEVFGDTERERERAPSFACLLLQALFSFQNFQDFSSHRILRHMHETLNIDENKN